MSKVRKAYLNLAKRFKFKIVNGENGAEETGAEIAKMVDDFLKSRQSINKTKPVLSY